MSDESRQPGSLGGSLLEIETLPQMLASRAQTDPNVEAYRFGGKGYSFGELWRDVNGFAAHLMRIGIERGERVMLALPNGPEFFSVFYGIQRAGGVAVPIFQKSGVERTLRLGGHCGARTLVIAGTVADDIRDRYRSRAEAAGIRCLVAGEDPDSSSHSEPAQFPKVAADDLAYIQYTSGSSGDPKGVQLSHASLLANIRQMIAGMEITPDDVFVSWLPVFHDMGLVLMTMVPFYLRARLILLPAVLSNIRIWLHEIERNRGTFTAAPDFAYRLSLRFVRNATGHDLSSLRVALNAAEPVRQRTLKEFERVFALDRVMMPGYGLAEATVGVSMWPPGTKVRVDDDGVVSVGQPFPGVDLAILGEDGRILDAPGVTGEILVRSPANTRGYLNNPEANARLFLRGSIRTGDIGYLDADGSLFVVGRKKTLIVQAGRSIAPREVEEIVDALSFVRYSAAVGIDRGELEGEQLYVFAEQRERQPPPAEECEARSIEIVRKIRDQLGLRPGRVYLVAPRTIPLTHNGKIRYAELAERYGSGTLRAEGSLFFPGW